MICCNQTKTNGNDQVQLPLTTAGSVAERVQGWNLQQVFSNMQERQENNQKKNQKMETENKGFTITKALAGHEIYRHNVAQQQGTPASIAPANQDKRKVSKVVGKDRTGQDRK